MNDGQTTFELLNAYVDSELDKATTTEIARAVADDPRLARQVASLSRLRSALADGVDVPPLTVTPPAPAGSPKTAIAASIAFLMFVAGSVLVSTFDRSLRADILQHAWQLHNGWSIDQKATQTRTGIVRAGYAKTFSKVYIPDLSAARLSLVHVVVKPFSGSRKALLAGFRGTRGCKISLTVFPAPLSIGEELSTIRDGSNEGYIWRTGSVGYILMSDGMDSARFKMLAKSVHQTSLQHLPFDQQTRMALRKSRDNSAPCLV